MPELKIGYPKNLTGSGEFLTNLEGAKYPLDITVKNHAPMPIVNLGLNLNLTQVAGKKNKETVSCSRIGLLKQFINDSLYMAKRNKFPALITITCTVNEESTESGNKNGSDSDNADTSNESEVKSKEELQGMSKSDIKKYALAQGVELDARSSVDDMIEDLFKALAEIKAD